MITEAVKEKIEDYLTVVEKRSVETEDEDEAKKNTVGDPDLFNGALITATARFGLRAEKSN